MDLEYFPSLSQEEFSEACHHLDRQYCQATLGPVRRRWKLRLCTALDTVFSLDGGYTTYIQIIRPLQPHLDHADLSLDLGNFSISDTTNEEESIMGDQDMMDAEQSDQVCHLWSS